MDITITLATSSDIPFIYSSWLQSYRTSPHTHKWSTEAYNQYQRNKINNILDRATVLVARPVDWPDGILGWLCFEQTNNTYYLHYVYTKTTYRRNHIAAQLLNKSEPKGTKYFTHLKLPYTGYLPVEYSLRKLHT